MEVDVFMELKGSKTEANLLSAFAGESQARNKYTFYASAARKEGFEQIAQINTLTLQAKQKKTDTFKSLIFLRKLQTMKRNMQSCGSSTCTTVMSLIPKKI